MLKKPFFVCFLPNVPNHVMDGAFGSGVCLPW